MKITCTLIFVLVTGANLLIGTVCSSQQTSVNPMHRNSEKTVVETSPVPSAQTRAPYATKQRPWENSLGMKFVPVPGTDVLFCIWDTRVQDYEQFVKETQREWRKPLFKQDRRDPAVYVSWKDAQAFCGWLTERERKIGRIDSPHRYRLPTDMEWSAGVGLPDWPDKPGLPFPKIDELERRLEERRKADKYPWGNGFPPPEGAGNYDPTLKIDRYEHTAPVGSFPANRYGLYDMGGNVWQWCENPYDPNRYYAIGSILEAEKKFRVIRGGSWKFSDPGEPLFVPSLLDDEAKLTVEAAVLLSTYRGKVDESSSGDDVGFRVVLTMSQADIGP